MTTHLFFSGVGGSGMSALARLCIARGTEVSGSDRARDRGDHPAGFAALEKDGVAFFPQDGSGVTDTIDAVIVSSAIEESVPDVKAAREKGIPIYRRAEWLAGFFNDQKGIGIAGTSGKTTVTAMIGHMLSACGAVPTVINGGVMKNFGTNALVPSPATEAGFFVAEMDESDGSIALFTPFLAVLNNVSLDHKPLAELRPLFAAFLKRARMGAVINADDPEAWALRDSHPVTCRYGIDRSDAELNARDVSLFPDRVSFSLSRVGDSATYRVTVPVPGRYNVSNALAALSVAHVLGLPMERAVKALEGFAGVRRRMEIVGSTRNITVIDDFAHNPDKIAASLSALKAFPGRVLIVFQPHGFGPLKLFKNSLINELLQKMDEDDCLFMPEAYYVGGTAERSVSSRDIVEAVVSGGRKGFFFEKRADILPALVETSRPGDRIVVMGARDDTLSMFAEDILTALSS